MQVYRVSLVKMTIAKYPKKNTPEPFMELRAFTFLRSLPTGIYLANLRKSLESTINEMIDKILPHIFEGKLGNYEFIEQLPADQISVGQKTRFYKVEIDGLEVEPVDLDEIFTERLFWNIRGFRMPFDHNLFSRRTIGRVLNSREKLSLLTGRIYRYIAFYDEDGEIKGEYDEADIRSMLTRIREVETQAQVLTTALSQATTQLDRVTKEIESAVSDLEKLTRRFKP